METQSKLRCYVAGALNADAVGYIKNLHRMIKFARELRDLGVAVYVPGNDFLEGLVDGNFDYPDYFNNSQPWLLASDFIAVTPGWEESNGTARELVLAEDAGIPICFNLKQVKQLIEEYNHGLRN